jgi:glyoxylase-like metal-dependent hydrolase (beta-lactamase superfamily II)
VTFLSEPEPPRGRPLPVPGQPGISRIVAANPGPMTYHGTNTWLVETNEGPVVVDPGPDDAAHVSAVVAALAGRRLRRILLTHTHRDHVGAMAALRAATGAPVAAYAPSALAGFTPDEALAEGARIGQFVALHTPGHASDHLCFALTGVDGTSLLFSGDHVMSWSSSVVSPPGGDMTLYMRNLSRLLERTDTLYLTGHGPPLPNPRTLVRALLAHRLQREQAIAAVLNEAPQELAELRARIYPALAPALAIAAERTVLAHLLKLAAQGRARAEGEAWRAA